MIHEFSLLFLKEKEITRQIAAINTIWKAYWKPAITHKTSQSPCTEKTSWKHTKLPLNSSYRTNITFNNALIFNVTSDDRQSAILKQTWFHRGVHNSPTRCRWWMRVGGFFKLMKDKCKNLPSNPDTLIA